ncbi:hypothetical protein [Raoultibacter massiliensis]|uniref:Uncharacterized protein n=1 Tax=Raoultibacter massiliensis TaxID=1852371 RepID=A0ABV1J9V3_9ACTN|nr:hypothetical protein [Raoultibacter massiliensis]
MSAEARRIHYDHTDPIELFGFDEEWLYITGSPHCLGCTFGLPDMRRKLCCAGDFKKIGK